MEKQSSVTLKNLIKYLAMTGGREKVSLSLLRYSGSFNISAGSLLPDTQSKWNL